MADIFQIPTIASYFTLARINIGTVLVAISILSIFVRFRFPKQGLVGTMLNGLMHPATLVAISILLLIVIPPLSVEDTWGYARAGATFWLATVLIQQAISGLVRSLIAKVQLRKAVKQH